MPISNSLKRVIVCLDLRGGRVVKGVNFRGLRDLGDPTELAEYYEAEGADEIFLLEISGRAEGRRALLSTIRSLTDRLRVPLIVGGGIRTVEDAGAALDAGAARITINSAGVERPELFTEIAKRFGSERVTASIDARWVQGGDGALYMVHTRGGRCATGLEVADWAQRCRESGAGEILLTSIDQDGRGEGYDLELTRRVADRVPIPVIASGGAGRARHLVEACTYGRAAGALAAGIFHRGTTSIDAVKALLAEAGLPVRGGTKGPITAVKGPRDR